MPKKIKREKRARKRLSSKQGSRSKKIVSQNRLLSETIQLGLSHHQAGNLHQAEQFYQKVLAADPNNVDANHLLGFLAHQAGKNDMAVQLIQKAVLIEPGFTEAHNNLGNVLTDLGKFDEAVSSYQHAVALKPDFAEAHLKLGNALRALTHYDQAIISYDTALKIKPDYAEAYNNLGTVLNDLGRHAGAELNFQRAAGIRPDFADVHYNLGVLYEKNGCVEKALASYKKTIFIKPDFAKAHNNLGNILKATNHLDEAIASYQKALSLKPDFADAHHNLGNMLEETNHLDGAIVHYQMTLEIDPKFSSAHIHLAIIFWLRSDIRRCVSHLEATSAYDPGKNPSRLNKFIVPYRNFLKKLVAYQRIHQNQYSHPEKYPPLYLMGDSHCLSFANTFVCMHEKKYKVSSKIIIGCKAWHLANADGNVYKMQMENIGSEINDESPVIFMFGEIDCRIDEGILPNARKTKTNLIQSISVLAKNYIAYILSVFRNKRNQLIIFGVRAPGLRDKWLSLQDRSDVLLTIQSLNQCLSDESAKKGLQFLDPYSLTKNNNGEDNGQYQIDGNHLKPSVLSLLLQAGSND